MQRMLRQKKSLARLTVNNSSLMIKMKVPWLRKKKKPKNMRPKRRVMIKKMIRKKKKRKKRSKTAKNLLKRRVLQKLRTIMTTISPA